MSSYREHVLVLSRRAVVLLFSVLLLGFSAVDATSGNWQSFVDHSYGLRVEIPMGWHTVPTTIPDVKSLVTQLSRNHQNGLAAAYLALIHTPQARTKLLSYHFQAFQYLPNTAVLPDFTLAFARTSHPFTTHDLSAVSTSVSNSFTKQGMKITEAKVVTLPAGPAAYVEGTQAGPGTDAIHFEAYLIPHGTLLYSLSFRAASSSATSGATFHAIANRFAFV
jgi:hypothetical protein